MGFFIRAMVVPGLAVAALVAASPASAAAPRRYDCSKAGNANKAACKAAASGPAAKASRTVTTRQTTTTTTRHYDCTKPGNANKAACRKAATQTSTGRRTPGAIARTTKTSSTTTDCTKWYNKVRATCRRSSSSTPAHTSVAPAPRPSMARSRPSNATGASGGGVNNNPNGAIAQCKDGSYSHSAHRSGACSRHGGVAKWLQG